MVDWLPAPFPGGMAALVVYFCRGAQAFGLNLMLATALATVAPVVMPKKVAPQVCTFSGMPTPVLLALH